MELNVMKLGQGRTLLLDAEGAPVLATLHARQARSAPSRVKAVFAAQVGDDKTVVLPFAGKSGEFRLEMN